MAIPRQDQVQITSWGNYPVATGHVIRPERYRDLLHLEEPYIPRGLGRSYGDAALLTNGAVVTTERLDRILGFDPKNGLLRAEAGLSLEAILEHFVPRGWFLPVTPGTKYVTLGGAVAADIHGKNHHVDGSFGEHVTELEIILPDGSPQRCSPNHNPELFWATVGGMGLTGMISEVSLRLHPIETSLIMTRNCPANNLEEVLALLSEGGADDKYSVAWIDCLATGKDLGRSIVLLGHHARADELPTSQQEDPLRLQPARKYAFPTMLPFSLINAWSVKLFNSAYYYAKKSKTEAHLTTLDAYFYPLDAIGHWNRIYGKKGFIQYQFVLPPEEASTGLASILERVAASRRASFLAVLKRFGPEGEGMLSFPKAGFTLALDLPVTDASLFTLLDELDEEVMRYGGRVYLAKDARLKAPLFRAMYPRYKQFEQVKAQIDPQNLIRSDLSQRLEIGVH